MHNSRKPTEQFFMIVVNLLHYIYAFIIITNYNFFLYSLIRIFRSIYRRNDFPENAGSAQTVLNRILTVDTEIEELITAAGPG